MLNVDHASGSIYHMVHFENLQYIFQRSAILSKEKVLLEGISYQSIAYENVQSLRDRIYVKDFSKQQFRPLHSYVPFYFATHTPMLYVQYRRGLQNEIVIFEVSRSILKDRGVVFTDGNAANQQLSQSSPQKVGITPATVSKMQCSRQYRPGGRPYGTNPNCSNFYADISFLNQLNWDIINGRNFTGDEEKRIKHAEVLVPDLLPLGRIQHISVSVRDKVLAVNTLIETYGLSERIPSAVYRPNLFFG
jgi:hypothetical protein